ncbi:MAG: sulfur carrier protein ThiS [Campylobacterota bacterium]
MKLIVNEIEKEFDRGITLSRLIEELQISDKVMALAVNMEVVKKDRWQSYTPKDGDEIELLNFVGGG